MKSYRIKPEFLPMWGSETAEGTTVTEAEIVRLSSEWGCTVNDLIKQVELVCDTSDDDAPPGWGRKERYT